MELHQEWTSPHQLVSAIQVPGAGLAPQLQSSKDQREGPHEVAVNYKAVMDDSELGRDTLRTGSSEFRQLAMLQHAMEV